LHLLPELLDLVADAARLRLGDIGLRPVRCLHRRKVTCDALINLLHACPDLTAREVAITIVDGFELAAVNGHNRL
jgi:hypothetical protein